jgi:hypothetical protein
LNDNYNNFKNNLMNLRLLLIHAPGPTKLVEIVQPRAIQLCGGGEQGEAAAGGHMPYPVDIHFADSHRLDQLMVDYCIL